MLVTANVEFAERARTLRSHGIVRSPDRFVGPADCQITGEKGTWFYEMQELGFNYRLTDLQAALGLSQLSRLKAFLARRREIVAAYNAAFAGLPSLSVPRMRDPRDAAVASWHLYTVQIDFAGLGKSRTSVMSGLRDAGVGTQVLYIPVHLQPWYSQKFGYAPGKCPAAEEFYGRALSLPLYSAMTDADVDLVIQSVRRIFLN
jgi:dTDP-4-amino-4,6-dideoxygalactose transaminase